MQNPELFACLSKERKENLLGTLLFRPSIYERLYYEEEMVRKQIVCYEEFLQIVRNPQIRAAAPEIDFEFEEFSANSYIALVDEYLYWNKVPGAILVRLKKSGADALADARASINFRQNEKPCSEHYHDPGLYSARISDFRDAGHLRQWLADPSKASRINRTKIPASGCYDCCRFHDATTELYIAGRIPINHSLRVPFSMRNLT